MCLRFPPRDIACSTVYLAGKYLQHADPQAAVSDECEQWAAVLEIDKSNLQGMRSIVNGKLTRVAYQKYVENVWIYTKMVQNQR